MQNNQRSACGLLPAAAQHCPDDRHQGLGKQGQSQTDRDDGPELAQEFPRRVGRAGFLTGACTAPNAVSVVSTPHSMQSYGSR